MKEKLKDISCRKTGTNYIILRIPKDLFEQMPLRFFMDLEIKDVRDAKPNDKKNIRKR